MRHEIDTVPKDGKIVILEDAARGAYELARWSMENAWVGEDGKTIPITPTHWLPLQRDECLLPEGDEYLLQREAESCDAPDPQIRHILPLSSGRAALEWPPAQEDAFAPRQDARAPVTFPVIEPRTVAIQPGPPAGRRLVVSSIAAAMISSSLIGMYFRAPIASHLTQFAAQHDIAGIGRIVEEPSKKTISLPVQESQQADLLGRAPAVQARGKSDGSEQTVAWEAVQTTMVSQAPEILEKERLRADGVENEQAGVPPSIDGRELRMPDEAATAPRSDREKISALLQELAAARQELTVNDVQYRKALAQESDRSATLARELATARQNVETQMARSNNTSNETTELKKTADTATSELQRERERADALASELTKVRREIDAAAAVSSQKADESAHLKRKAETAAAELQQSLQQERQRAETLSSDLDKVQREFEALTTLASQKDDNVSQLKREAETATAELQQSLQQQRDKAQALEGELATARQNADAQVATLGKINEEAARTKPIETVTANFVGALGRQKSAPNQAAEYAKAEPRPSLHQEREQPKGNPPKAEPTRQLAGTAATEQSVSTEAKGSEAPGLLARAKALLDQGNIGAARVVLERAAETGSAQATFALAETYDPNVLAAWRTYGTRGDGAKARDLYARAYHGGIKAAKDRSDMLVGGDGGQRPTSWSGHGGADH